MKARLLSMEIPAHVGEISDNPLNDDSADNGTDYSKRTDRLVKIDPYRGSWGLRFLELELSNPTDVVFEVGVSVQLESTNIEDNNSSSEFDYPKTRIDRDYTARVLIPLEHFKLPVLDGSFLGSNPRSNGDGGKTVNFSEKNKKAELNASIKNLISKIKVRWVSGRNSSGELHIKDATQAALQTSVMDVLLPDPLTFSFRLVKDHIGESENLLNGSSTEGDSLLPKGPVLAHDMTPMEVVVRNNTKDSISMCLNITCRDVAGENCIEGSNSAVLWSGKTVYALCVRVSVFLCSVYVYMDLCTFPAIIPGYLLQKTFFHERLDLMKKMTPCKNN